MFRPKTATSIVARLLNVRVSIIGRPGHLVPRSPPLVAKTAVDPHVDICFPSAKYVFIVIAYVPWRTFMTGHAVHKACHGTVMAYVPCRRLQDITREMVGFHKQSRALSWGVIWVSRPLSWDFTISVVTMWFEHWDDVAVGDFNGIAMGRSMALAIVMGVLQHTRQCNCNVHGSCEGIVMAVRPCSPVNRPCHGSAMG